MGAEECLPEGPGAEGGSPGDQDLNSKNPE